MLTVFLGAEVTHKFWKFTHSLYTELCNVQYTMVQCVCILLRRAFGCMQKVTADTPLFTFMLMQTIGLKAKNREKTPDLSISAFVA